MSYEDIVQLDKKTLFNTYQRYPLAIERGLGTKVWDFEGREYLDLLGGIAVLPLGHCHPKVVEAICKQASTLMHTSNLFYTKPTLELAQCLIEMGDFQKVFLANSGTEANEGAIKLARKYQWRKGRKDKFKIVSATHSFHGRTFASLSATDKPELKEGFDPLPGGFSTVEWNNVESLQLRIDDNTAAFIVEPLQGEGGIYLASEEFLKAARECCDKVGALLIFDEIQCGLGRLGTFYAYQSFGVVPDVVTLAKGLANGLPIGAICAKEEAANGFQLGDHGTTFGGNLVCAAAANATLQTILEKDYCSRAKQMGDYFFEELLKLKNEFPTVIKDVRGKGLMIGVEIEGIAQKLASECLNLGLILNVTAKQVLRILPAYVIEKEDIDRAIKIMRMALQRSLP
jgi:predicted acetylornithine/succinylornithine family transaminase